MCITTEIRLRPAGRDTWIVVEYGRSIGTIDRLAGGAYPWTAITRAQRDHFTTREDAIDWLRAR